MRTRLYYAVAAVQAAMAFAAPAQIVPDIETGPVITRGSLSNGQVQLRDADTNAPLIVARGYPLFASQDPSVIVQVGFQEQPSGFDLIFDLDNKAGIDKPIGRLSLGIITLGLDINYMDIRDGVEPVAVNANSYSGWAYEYPTYLYSPAFILTNANYAMGISLQYPILEYKHHVKLNLNNPGGSYLNGEGGRGWAPRFILSTHGAESWQIVDYGAMMKPGEKRRYVMSVRVTRNPAEWVRTLVPYRNYFRAMYGGVRYERDTAPVWGTLASDPSWCSASNPLGWLSSRQDINGWAPMATVLRDQTVGWSGTMLWLPSGCYWQNPQNNFPCTPASTWLNTPTLSTIFNRVTGMPSVSAAGKEMGFWWGQSCKTAATWDPPVLEKFDPDNPVHFRRQIGELDVLARAGATMIGLDTFDPVDMPFWKQYRWIETMRLRHPQIKFITEPTNCDIMHTMAANFIAGWEFNRVPQTVAECYTLWHPNYLADFLVPGHEYWGGMNYFNMKQYFGITPDQARVLADLQRYASYGYRPCFQVEHAWWGLTIPPGVVSAAKSWETSVPADLQISDEPIPFGALSTGSRPSRSGGSNVVAGYRPARPGGTGRLNTSAAGPRPQIGVAVRQGPAGPAAVSAVDPRMNSKAEQRRVANAIRRARGLPPLPPEDPEAADDGSGVQTFTSDRPTEVPTKAPPPPDGGKK